MNDTTKYEMIEIDTGLGRGHWLIFSDVGALRAFKAGNTPRPMPIIMTDLMSQEEWSAENDMTTERQIAAIEGGQEVMINRVGGYCYLDGSMTVYNRRPASAEEVRAWME